jgi:nitrate/TMAO reductase-like tetraheme cytochrome c subunit
MNRVWKAGGLLIVLGFIVLVGACDRDVTRVVEKSSSPVYCFECHSDQDLFLVAAERQWENSVHASGNNIDRNSASCAGCHTSEGFVERIETGSVAETIENPNAIHCFTCHAPHTNRNLTRRVEDPYPLEDGTLYDLHDANLCVACHHARRDVNTYVSDGVSLSTHWGPHHNNQGDILIGSNGYEYSDYDYVQTLHRSATKDGCLDCHFAVTSNYILGGHSFNMEFETEGGEVHNVAACQQCHATATDFNYKRVRTVVDSMMTELHDLLMTAGLVDASGHPLGGRVVATADSAGAVWNFLMAEEERSHGVHNPNYVKGLLESSIQFMNGTLGSAPAVASRD